MFLTATYIKTPTGLVGTSAVGFWENHNNYHYEEHVAFVKNLRLTDLKRANIILDLDQQEVLKCRGKKNDTMPTKNQTYNEIYEYFYTHYKEHMDKILNFNGMNFKVDTTNITTNG